MIYVLADRHSHHKIGMSRRSLKVRQWKNGRGLRLEYQTETHEQIEKVEKEAHRLCAV
jgi:hypothetical protein